MIEPHERRTRSGLHIADPDQGVPHVVIHLAVINVFVHVYEPFEDGTEGGHNIFGFLERYEHWLLDREQPYLLAREPRFGFPVAMPRSLIPHVSQITLEYRRKEDVRAGVGRAIEVPVEGRNMRRRADGSIDIRVPAAAIPGGLAS